MEVILALIGACCIGFGLGVGFAIHTLTGEVHR